jgi:hypothetical protein
LDKEKNILEEYESISDFKKRTKTFLSANTIAAEAHLLNLKVKAKRTTVLLYKDLDSILKEYDVLENFQKDNTYENNISTKEILKTSDISLMKKCKIGFCYLVKYKFQDKELLKIGYTKNNVQDRVTELINNSLEEYNTKIEIEVLHSFKTTYPCLIEKKIHEACIDFKIDDIKNVSGYTELFEYNNIVIDFFKNISTKNNNN